MERRALYLHGHLEAKQTHFDGCTNVFHSAIQFFIYFQLLADILCDSAQARNSKSSLSNYYCDYRHILYSKMEIVLKV